ncbi:Mss4-like protein [Rhypophila decipiens]
MSTHQKETINGRCVCNKVRYTLELVPEQEGDSKKTSTAPRTTLCHCSSCRRAFGTNYGLTAKVALENFRYDEDSAAPRKFKQENGVTREFCENCGAYLVEYGEAAADKFRYIMWGTMDEPDRFPPKGEFFCKNRAGWMPQIPGAFQKQEIKE